MADQVKVFKNVVNQAFSNTYNAVTLSGLTTNSSTKAVVKDVQFKIRNSDSSFDGVYSYPATVKLGNYPLAELSDGTNIALTGSQIIDTSSTFNIEIQAEDAKINYGTSAVLMQTNTNVLTLLKSNLNIIDATDVEIVANDLTISKKDIANVDSLTGGTTSLYGMTHFYRNGKNCFAFGADTSQIHFLDEDGVELNPKIALGFASYQYTADNNYIYVSRSSSSTTLTRIAISNFAVSTVNLNATLNGIGSSNPGFFEYYNGFIYSRWAGSTSNIQKINVSTGAVTDITNFSLNQSEHLGARITVNRSGVPLLVEWGDTNGGVYNLATNTVVTTNLTFPSGSGLTDPTTTTQNHSFAIAPGMILFNNSSYNQTWVLDVNNLSDIKFYNTSTLLQATPGTGRAAASAPFQTTLSNIPRTATYDMLISGIESN